MNNNIVTSTDKNFQEEVLEASLPVLVDFWAPWCGNKASAQSKIGCTPSEVKGQLRKGDAKITPEFKNGVLKLVFQKKASSKPRQIYIKVG